MSRLSFNPDIIHGESTKEVPAEPAAIAYLSDGA
jgi:hypothetical protein